MPTPKKILSMILCLQVLLLLMGLSYLLKVQHTLTITFIASTLAPWATALVFHFFKTSTREILRVMRYMLIIEAIFWTSTLVLATGSCYYEIKADEQGNYAQSCVRFYAQNSQIRHTLWVGVSKEDTRAYPLDMSYTIIFNKQLVPNKEYGFFGGDNVTKPPPGFNEVSVLITRSLEKHDRVNVQLNSNFELYALAVDATSFGFALSILLKVFFGILFSKTFLEVNEAS